MVGTVASILYPAARALAVLACLVAPVAAMVVMFWNWSRERSEFARLHRQGTD